MKKLLVFAFGLMVAVPIGFGLIERTATPVEAASSHSSMVMMGGGTAVLFNNGDIYDLTMNGWVRSGHLPPDIKIVDVAVVLSSNRIVLRSGVAMVMKDATWTPVPAPIK